MTSIFSRIPDFPVLAREWGSGKYVATQTSSGFSSRKADADVFHSAAEAVGCLERKPYRSLKFRFEAASIFRQKVREE
jgi:hypothetical protein